MSTQNILVIGEGAVCDPAKAGPRIRKVLQSLAPLVGQGKVGIFTEYELTQDRSILGQFLGLS